MCPAEILELLANEKPDRWSSIGIHLALNPSTPENVLIKLGRKDRTSEVCANPSATAAVFKALLQSKSATVRSKVVSAPKTPRELLAGLEVDADPLVRSAIAKRTDTPPEIQKILATDSTNIVRLALSSLKTISIELRLVLAKDTDARVRYSALFAGGLPESFYIAIVLEGERSLPPNVIVEIKDEATLVTLARDGDDAVQSSILRRTSVPEAALMILAEKAEHRRNIAEREDVPMSLLERFVVDSDVSVVAASLSNPMIPELLIRKTLANNPRRDYWVAVSENHFCPQDLLDLLPEKIEFKPWSTKSWHAKKLAGDNCRHQSAAFLLDAINIAKNTRTSQEKLRSLTASGIWLIRRTVAANASLPESERKQLITELWSEVEDALWSPRPPLPSFDLLQKDGILSALRRLDLAPPVQDKRAIALAAKSPKMLRRVAAILSPGIQPSLLKMLLEDTVDNVKALAAATLREMGKA